MFGLKKVSDDFQAAGLWGRLKMSFSFVAILAAVSFPATLAWHVIFSEIPVDGVNLSLRFRVDNMLMESGPDARAVQELEACVAKTGMRTSHERGDDIGNRAYGRWHTIIVHVCDPDRLLGANCMNTNGSRPEFAYTRTQVRLARQCFVLAREQRAPLPGGSDCYGQDTMGFPVVRKDLWCLARDFSKEVKIEH